MNVRAASLALTLSTLCAAAATAGESHDLRRLLNRKPPVGETVRTVEEETKIQAMGPRKMEEKPAWTYVEEVQAVGADGEPTRVLRTYEAFRDKSGAEVKVEGVKVQLTRDETTGRHAFAAAEGSAPLPAQVQAEIQHDLDGKNERADKGITDEQLGIVMLPEGARAVGDTWPIDVSELVRMFGFEQEDVDLAASSASGTFEAVESADGHEWVKFFVTMKLVLVRAPGQGQPLPGPSPMDTTMRFRLPATGEAPDGDTHMTQHIELAMGGPQGQKGVMTIDVVKTERRTVVQ